MPLALISLLVLLQIPVILCTRLIMASAVPFSSVPIANVGNDRLFCGKVHVGSGVGSVTYAPSVGDKVRTVVGIVLPI